MLEIPHNFDPISKIFKSQSLRISRAELKNSYIDLKVMKKINFFKSSFTAFYYNHFCENRFSRKEPILRNKKTKRAGLEFTQGRER